LISQDHHDRDDDGGGPEQAPVAPEQDERSPERGDQAEPPELAGQVGDEPAEIAGDLGKREVEHAAAVLLGGEVTPPVREIPRVAPVDRGAGAGANGRVEMEGETHRGKEKAFHPSAPPARNRRIVAGDEVQVCRQQQDVVVVDGQAQAERKREPEQRAVARRCAQEKGVQQAGMPSCPYRPAEPDLVQPGRQGRLTALPGLRLCSGLSLGRGRGGRRDQAPAPADKQGDLQDDDG